MVFSKHLSNARKGRDSAADGHGHNQKHVDTDSGCSGGRGIGSHCPQLVSHRCLPQEYVHGCRHKEQQEQCIGELGPGHQLSEPDSLGYKLCLGRGTLCLKGPVYQIGCKKSTDIVQHNGHDYFIGAESGLKNAGNAAHKHARRDSGQDTDYKQQGSRERAKVKGGDDTGHGSCVKLALCTDIQHTAPGTHGHGQACKGQRNALADCIGQGLRCAQSSLNQGTVGFNRGFPCQEDKKGSYQKRKPYGCQGFAYFRCVPAAADFSNGPGFLTCPVTSVCLGVLIAVPFHEPAPPVFFLP